MRGKVASGNYVGTNPAGDAPVPNGRLRNRRRRRRTSSIGGTADGRGQPRLRQRAATASTSSRPIGAVVQGNLVGTDATGTVAIANGAGRHRRRRQCAIIGGIGPGEGNIVAYNLGSGIEVQGVTAALDGNTDPRQLDLRQRRPRDRPRRRRRDGQRRRRRRRRPERPPELSDHSLGGADSAPSGTHVAGHPRQHGVDRPSTSTSTRTRPARAVPQDFPEGRPTSARRTSRPTAPATRPSTSTSTFTIEVGQPVTVTATDPNGQHLGALAAHRVLHRPGLRDLRRAARSSRSSAPTSTTGATVTVGGQPGDGRRRRQLDPDHGDDAGAAARHARQRRRDQPRRDQRNAPQRLGRRTSSTCPRATVLPVRHDPRPQRHHGRRRRRQLRRRPAHAAPADGGLPPEGEVRHLLRAAALHAGVFADVPCPSAFAAWIEELAAAGHHRRLRRRQLLPAEPRPPRPDGRLPAEGRARIDLRAARLHAGVFADVPCPGTFADWIEQLAAEDITGGCGGGNYCPLQPEHARADGGVHRQDVSIFSRRTNDLGQTPAEKAGVLFLPRATGRL